MFAVAGQWCAISTGVVQWKCVDYIMVQGVVDPSVMLPVQLKAWVHTTPLMDKLSDTQELVD